MVLNTQLCKHAAYRGGQEKNYHRAANGHTRTVQCKEDECERAIITAKRSSPIQIWSFLVQVAARQGLIYQRVRKVRLEDL